MLARAVFFLNDGFAIATYALGVLGYAAFGIFFFVSGIVIPWQSRGSWTIADQELVRRSVTGTEERFNWSDVNSMTLGRPCTVLRLAQQKRLRLPTWIGGETWLEFQMALIAKLQSGYTELLPRAKRWILIAFLRIGSPILGVTGLGLALNNKDSIFQAIGTEPRNAGGLLMFAIVAIAIIPALAARILEAKTSRYEFNGADGECASGK